jgi:hypothetical protein
MPRRVAGGLRLSWSGTFGLGRNVGSLAAFWASLAACFAHAFASAVARSFTPSRRSDAPESRGVSTRHRM